MKSEKKMKDAIYQFIENNDEECSSCSNNRDFLLMQLLETIKAAVFKNRAISKLIFIL